MVALALHVRYAKIVEDWHEAPESVRARFAEGTRIVSCNYGSYVGFEKEGLFGKVETGFKFSWRDLRDSPRDGQGPRAVSSWDQVAGHAAGTAILD